jgi:hypothetical protein
MSITNTIHELFNTGFSASQQSVPDGNVLEACHVPE